VVRQHGIGFGSFSPVKSKLSSTAGSTITSADNGTLFIFGIKYYFFFFVLNEDE
jgi:hypothetical protein